MKKIIVIGGGFAGLSAAVYLADRNYKVTLIESSPKLGGRAYSFYHPKLNSIIDNGQHLMMGCYTNTLSFLSKIEATDYLEIQKNMRACFVKRNGSKFNLAVSNSIYPINLLFAILKFNAINLKSRVKIIDLFLDLCFCWTCDLKEYSVLQWLREKKQTNEAIHSFWEIICIGTLNSPIDKASASIFAEVLKRIFFDGNDSTKFIIPKAGLSELYVQKSKEYLFRKNCQIIVSEKVLRLEQSNSCVECVITNKNSYTDFDYVISTLPSHQLKKIFERSNISTKCIPELKYSPILNAYLKLSKNPFTNRFYGLIDSKIHWIFNHGGYISLTISAAEDLILLTNDEIFQILYSELEIFFSIFKKELVTNAIIIKEKKATFISDFESIAKRENFHSPFENLIISGDWTNTGLPSTIESAVTSAVKAVEIVL
jgi:squalene-associated FAD-dependent desaturase